MTVSLNAIDTNSLTWKAIETWAETERAKLVNDLIKGTPNDFITRGHIARLDNLLALGRIEKPDRKPNEPFIPIY